MKITDLINNQIKRYLDNFIPGVIFTIFAFTLVATILPDIGGFSLENVLYDFRMTYKMYNSKIVYPTKNISVVLIDDIAISNDRRLKDSGPISRTYLADLINKIVKQKPKVIGIDFFLNTISLKPEDDLALKKAIDNAIRNKVRIVFVSSMFATAYNGTVILNPIKTFYDVNNQLTSVGHPYLNYNKMDFTVRSLDIIKGDQTIQPAFALRIAEEFSDKQYDLEGNYLIDFSTPLKEVYNLSSSYNILNNSDKNSSIQLKDKVILIGAGYESASDRYYTPITGRFGKSIKLSGPEIHACVVDNIIKDSNFHIKPNTSLTIIITLVLFLVTFIVFQKLKLKEIYFIMLSILLITLYSLYYFDKVNVTLVRPIGLWIILSLLFWENNDHIQAAWEIIKIKYLGMTKTPGLDNTYSGDISNEENINN